MASPDPAVALAGRFTLNLVFSILAATSGSSFVIGYNLGVINMAGFTIQRWIAESKHMKWENSDNITDQMQMQMILKDVSGADQSRLTLIWSLVVGLFPLGAMFGGIASGVVADSVGRKGGLFYANILTVASAIVMCSSKSVGHYWVLMLGRFLSGINCGLANGIFPIYLTEIAPINLRGLSASVGYFVLTVATLVSNVVGTSYVMGTRELWPYLFLLTLIPCAVQVTMLPFCPESPKYLLMIKNQKEIARKAIVWLRNTDKVDDEVNFILVQAEKFKDLPTVTFWDLIAQPVLRWKLFIALELIIGLQFSGVNAALYYSTEIFSKVNLSSDEASGATLGMLGTMIVLTAVAVIFVDAVGRRPLLLTSVSGMLVSLIFITISEHLALTQNFSWAAYLLIPSIYLYAIFYSVGGSIPYFYVSESFDSQSRGRANSLTISLNWFLASVIGFTFPSIQKALCEFLFLVFAVCTVVHFVFILKFVPETKDKTVEQVSDEIEERRRSCFVREKKPTSVIW